MSPQRKAKIQALSIAWQVVDTAGVDIMMDLGVDNDKKTD